MSGTLLEGATISCTDQIMAKPAKAKKRFNPFNPVPIFPELPYIVLASFLLAGLTIDVLGGHKLRHSVEHAIHVLRG